MAYIEINNVGKTFQGRDGKPFEALTNVNLNIEEGEFVSIIGHSGCGKSTLLNMVGGFIPVTSGQILVAGKPVTEPGPDRMFVFQNHSLLPWLTVRQNIRLAVDAVYPSMPADERAGAVEEHIKLVHLGPAAEKLPSEISGGMKQRVGIARALATRPKVLMLDEPFGALDALTRGRLQEQVLAIWEAHRITVMMVTHDVEEALLLSDRVVMMANGPRATVGEIMTVDLPRPRTRSEAINHPAYYRQRNEMLYFLNKAKREKKAAEAPAKAAETAVATPSEGKLEKTELTLGFIPLSDCAPLVMAQEKGLFEKHGLKVKLSREGSWKAIADGVAEGRLDAAMMVTGMPIGRTLGIYKTTPTPMGASMVLSRNGNAITLARKFHERGVRTRADLRAYLDKRPSDERKPIFGMVFGSSMHNLLLRHWLSAGGIDPEEDVEIIAVPPPQMASNLAAGNLDGYCVGEPWNARAVHEGIGFVIATDLDIYPGHPEKLLGMTQAWANANPETHVALVKALLESCRFCDETANREEVIQTISRKAYVNADPIYSSLGLSGSYDYGFGRTEKLPDFNVFFRNGSTRCDKSEALWVLSQMARWGLVDIPADPRAVIDQIYLEDVYARACSELGIAVPPSDYHTIALPDGSVFDPDASLAHPAAETPDTAPIAVRADDLAAVS
jgi:nitrate/nitrite transport system ATP-binding protein